VPLLHPNVPPPPHYYADNVVRLLAAVHRHIATSCWAERTFIAQIFALSVDAQRLFARLLTRKGPLIARLATIAKWTTFRRLTELDGAIIERNPRVPGDQLLTLTPPNSSHSRRTAQRPAVDVIAARYPNAAPARESRRCFRCVLVDRERLM
jgi:hypothetical protein